MKRLPYFIGFIALTGFLLYWSRFELEYSVIELGVFEQTQVLRRDKWKWEGSVTDLKYYEVCRRPDGPCWRRLPDRSYWVIDRPSYDSPYISIVANNRNGKRVETEFRLFETREGKELKCRDCDLNDFVRSETWGFGHLTGDLVFIQTYLGEEPDSEQRMRVLEIVDDHVVVHHLEDVHSSSWEYGYTIARTNSGLRATAWIVCDVEVCRLREYWIDSRLRAERVVQCTSGPKEKLEVRVEEGRFVPDCE